MLVQIDRIVCGGKLGNQIQQINDASEPIWTETLAITMQANIWIFWSSALVSDISLFLEGGASNDPCSEIYAGPKPYSEPETLALTEFVKTFNLKFYFAFHSYSQQILYPFVSGNNQVFYKYWW